MCVLHLLSTSKTTDTGSDGRRMCQELSIHRFNGCSINHAWYNINQVYSSSFNWIYAVEMNYNVERFNWEQAFRIKLKIVKKT